MSKRILGLVCCGALLLAGMSCDKKGSSTVTIGVIPKGTTHVFWKSVKAGADKAGKELNVAIKWDGPPDEKEISRQTAIIGDMINRGVDALVVAPVDKTALTSSLENAKKKMPVVVFDSGSDFKDYSAFVATDNYEGGKLGAQAMIKLLKDMKDGDIELAVVKYQAGSSSTMDRERGFLEEFKKARPGVKIYAEQYAGSTGEEASKFMSNLLQAHPNINAVFGSNESTTRGALGALEQAKKLGKVKFVGFDSSAELLDGLTKGNIQALVLQDPVNMGYRAVKAAVAALRGEKVEKDQPLAPVVATPENMNQPEISNLLRPKFD